MKKLNLFWIVLFAAFVVQADFAQARIGRGTARVRGHMRGSGYVFPHYRTNPGNGSIRNNWSTQGNINPYTGHHGYQSPF